MLRNQKVRNLCFLLSLCCCTAYLLLHPQEAVDAAKTGMHLCVNVVVPSLFPFLILSGLVVRLGFAQSLKRILEPVMRPVFGLSGSCASALALGLIGGYPVGAKTAVSLYRERQINKKEVERLLAFCNNCGPAFLFGVVGAGVFANSRIGLLLYLIHILASILVGIVFQLLFGSVPSSFNKTHPANEMQSFPKALTGSIQDAISSSLNIGGFIVSFTILIRFAFSAGLIPAIGGLLARIPGISHSDSEAMLVGMIELSSGVWGLKEASAALPSKVAMAAFMLGWAGLCVHCQVLSFTEDEDLSIRPYLTGKLLHGIISTLLFGLLFRLAPVRATLASNYAEQVAYVSAQSFLKTLLQGTGLAAAAFFLCWLCFILQKKGGNRQRRAL